MHANDKIRYHTYTTVQQIQIQHTTSEGHTSGSTNYLDLVLLVALIATKET